MKQMTEQALVQALREAQIPKESGRGVRVEEIRKATGMGEERICRMLRAFIEAGCVGVSTRHIIRLDGKRATVSGYYWKGKGKK